MVLINVANGNIATFKVQPARSHGIELTGVDSANTASRNHSTGSSLCKETQDKLVNVTRLFHRKHMTGVLNYSSFNMWNHLPGGLDDPGWI
jgi:hypothetical protein